MAGIILTSFLSIAIAVIFLAAGLYNYKKGGEIEPKYFFFLAGIFFVIGVFGLLYFLQFFQ